MTACASDGSLVYSLGPAVVTGTQWDTLRVDDVSVPGTTQIDALLDPSGSSALTQATGELFSNDEPRNQLAVYAEGVVLSAPTVQQPIYGGALVIAGGLTNDEAQALLTALPPLSGARSDEADATAPASWRARRSSDHGTRNDAPRDGRPRQRRRRDLASVLVRRDARREPRRSSVQSSSRPRAGTPSPGRTTLGATQRSGASATRSTPGAGTAAAPPSSHRRTASATWRPSSAATSAVSTGCTRLPAANTPGAAVRSARVDRAAPGWRGRGRRRRAAPARGRGSSRP